MLKPNPVEIRMASQENPEDPPTADSVMSLDGVYRYGLVYHCNKVLGREQKNENEDAAVDMLIEYRTCPSCGKNVPMTQPVYTCGHELSDQSKCGFQSKSRVAVEYHITDAHTDHCPVCLCLIGSGAGGKGCACPR